MSSIKLDTYCDEIHRVTDNSGSTWMYMGMLFVRHDQKEALLKELLDMRCIQRNSWEWDESQCPYKCGYHDRNDTEIKYSDLHRSNARYRIACRWLNDFLIEKNNRGNRGMVYFNIIGLNLTNMNLEYFGSDKSRDLTIYNRFFRTVLKGGAKYFFSEYDNIIIETLYHDKGSQQMHNYFPWYTGYRLNLEDDDKILVENEDVVFVDSNHRIYLNEDGNLRNESQFIQFMDLILGSIYCCLHNPAERKEKKGVGQIMMPLLQRLLNNPRNVNSNYHYYRKQQISFFPKNRLTDLTRVYQQLDIFGNKTDDSGIPDNFYTKRPILLQPKEQTTLFERE